MRENLSLFKKEEEDGEGEGRRGGMDTKNSRSLIENVGQRIMTSNQPFQVTVYQQAGEFLGSEDSWHNFDVLMFLRKDILV